MINRLEFYRSYRRRFHKKLTQTQVEGYEAIFDYWDLYKLRNIKSLAYVLATAYHETGGRMEPVREGFCKTDEGSIRAVARLYKRGKISTNYALPGQDGNSYFGRGLVQITWEDNYRRLGRAIGLGDNLCANPSLALDLNIAVRILFTGMIDGLFTDHKLVDYITDHKCDYYNARRIVNGLDKAELICSYASKFEKCLFVGDPNDKDI